MVILRDEHLILKLAVGSPEIANGITNTPLQSIPCTNPPRLPHCYKHIPPTEIEIKEHLLVICWRFVVWVELCGLHDAFVSFVLQSLAHSHLTSVQSLPIVTVDGLGRWRPLRGEREGGMVEQRQPGRGWGGETSLSSREEEMEKQLQTSLMG